MQYEQIRLNNELETLFVHSPGSTAASVQIWFRAGSALEKKENEGIAHFLEHMFFKGTPTRPGANIAHEIESFGGELNAFTSFDYTCYYVNTPIARLEDTIDILLDMVSNPTFKEEDLIPERGVVFEEYRRSQDNPGQFSFQALQRGTFTKGYAHPILGREETIKNFTRDQLVEFRNNFYNLSNAMLVVAGDLKDKEKISKKIESYKMPSGPHSSFPEFELKTKDSVEIHQKDVKMSQLYFCLQAPHFTHADAAAEDLAFNCLGHGESSKVYSELVLQGSLANSVGCSTMFMNKGGAHFIRLSFPHQNFSKVLKKLENSIIDTLKNGFDDSEVNKIKNQYIASKIYDMESIESYAFSLGHSFAQTGTINSEEEFISRIKKSSTKSVNSALINAFTNPHHLNLQISLDEDINKSEEILKKFQGSLKKKINSLKKPSTKKIKSKVSKFDPQVQLIKLKSGIQLVYRQNLMNPTFVFHTYLKGGMTEENLKTSGSYQMLAGLLTKGYRKKNYDFIRKDLENKSASLSGFSGKNAYGLTMHGQSDHFSELMDHFFGSLLSPSMPATLVKHEKEITLRNIESRTVDPVKRCFEEVTKLFFNAHPYSMPMLGTEKSVKSIKRTSLFELHAKNLRTKEILFTYCGDKDLEEVISLVEKQVTTLKARAEKKALTKKIKPIINKEIFVDFDREQTQIFYGIPVGKLGSKENLYLKMLTTHLSGQSSELFVEVRDRQGLCYTAQPVNFVALEAGYWGIYMASGHDKVEAAVAAIKDIINRTQENGLTREEFDRIKKMIEGQNQLSIQTNDDYANIYSVTTLQGHGLDYYHKKSEALSSLKYEDFQTQIKKILSKKWNTVIVGRQD